MDRVDLQPEVTQEQLVALLRISQALSKHRDREGLFTAIAEVIDGLLPADRVIILVSGLQGAAVSVYAVRGAEKLFEGESIPEDSVRAWVIRHRQPLVVASPEQVRERFPTTHRKLTEERMQSAVVLPLLVQDRCLGALGFMASAASAFASSVAVALDGCLAYEQLQRLGQERTVAVTPLLSGMTSPITLLPSTGLAYE